MHRVTVKSELISLLLWQLPFHQIAAMFQPEMLSVFNNQNLKGHLSSLGFEEQYTTGWLDLHRKIVFVHGAPIVNSQYGNAERVLPSPFVRLS